MKVSGGLICQGIIDGENGSDGYNVVSVPLFRRSANALSNSDRPNGPLTYTFSTGKVTGSYFNGWSQNIPAAQAGTKLYVTMATARSKDDTYQIAANEWSTPVEYISDGMNSAPVMIYKRADSISSNDKPSNGCTYNFSTGELSGTLNGWSTTIPSSNGHPCWVRHATAVSNTSSDTINADEWSSAQKLVEDGNKGEDAQYIYLKGSAFDKDSGGSNNTANNEIRVNGGNNLATQSRGLCLVTLNRQTLAVVDSAVVYDTYEGSTGISNLITKLNGLDNSVFVCLVSYDAIGWSDTLISLLQTFGMSDLPYTSTGRYPFLFIGYKNLGYGNGITRMNDLAEPAIPVELAVYVANGALSVKDGENGNDGDDAVVFELIPEQSIVNATHDGTITTGDIVIQAYKIVGNERSTDILYYDDQPEPYHAQYAIDNGSFVDCSEEYIPRRRVRRTYIPASDVQTATTRIQLQLLNGNNEVVAVCPDLVVVKDGEQGPQGDKGRMFYLAGTYPVGGATYYRTDKVCPVVYYEPDANTKEYWYLDADNNQDGNGNNIAPSDTTGNPWKIAEKFGITITEALFAAFAKLGSFVVYGNFFFSQYGTLIYNNGGTITRTTINASNYNTLVGGQMPYTYFDGTTTDPSSGNYKFIPSMVLDALTGRAWFGSDKIRFNQDGSGSLANGNISWDANGETSFKGSTKSPFTEVDYISPSFWDASHDNYGTMLINQAESRTLPAGIEYSGRRLVIVNGYWNGYKASNSGIGLNPATGTKLFNNTVNGVDGQETTTGIYLAHGECIELLGYGDETTFYGWIILRKVKLYS